MTRERWKEILHLVDAYNRAKGEDYISPFIARHQGVLGKVAQRIGVPTQELDEFLTLADAELPQDYLMG